MYQLIVYQDKNYKKICRNRNLKFQSVSILIVQKSKLKINLTKVTAFLQNKFQKRRILIKILLLLSVKNKDKVQQNKEVLTTGMFKETSNQFLIN